MSKCHPDTSGNSEADTQYVRSGHLWWLNLSTSSAQLQPGERLNRNLTSVLTVSLPAIELGHVQRNALAAA
jgi:hypothetical protein